MNGVTVVTGSSAGLAKDLGIHVVPIVLALNGHSLLDGVEMTPVMGAHIGPGVLGLAFYADQAV